MYSIYSDSCAFGECFLRQTGDLISETEIFKMVHICKILTWCLNADVIFDKNYLDVDALPSFDLQL